jgi:glycosyltransferase involved in cell wall biosynthesis
MKVLSRPPLVSVVLPTYNRAPLVMRAIDSVLGQEFDNLELIVIDDGSTDHTAQVVLQAEDKRIRYFHLDQNRGETFARNAGIQYCRGEFIAQMDSDDIWYPQKISHKLDLFSRFRQLDLIFCNMIDIDHMTGTRSEYFRKRSAVFERLQVRALEEGVMEILGGLPEVLLLSTIIPHPTVMLRVRVLGLIGVYNENLRGAGDFEYWWRASLKGAKFAYTTRVLMDRHTDAQSLTADRLALHERHLQALEFCERTAQELGRTDLLPLLRDAKYRSWHGLMLEQSRRGMHREAYNSLWKSLKYIRRVYGILVVWPSYLLSTAFGPRSVERIRAWLKPDLLESIRRMRQPSH